MITLYIICVLFITAIIMHFYNKKHKKQFIENLDLFISIFNKDKHYHTNKEIKNLLSEIDNMSLTHNKKIIIKINHIKNKLRNNDK